MAHETQVLSHRIPVNEQNNVYSDFCHSDCVHLAPEKLKEKKTKRFEDDLKEGKNNTVLLTFKQPTEYFDMGIFLAFFVVVSLVCLILLVKIKLKQRRSQVRAVIGMLKVSFSCFVLKGAHSFWKRRTLPYISHLGGSVVLSMWEGLWKNLEISLKEIYVDP